MLMTLIQKEIMHHVLSVRFGRAAVNVPFARSADPFDQLP